MIERICGSTEELFREVAPDILEYLSEDDVFWKQVRENTITDQELDGHQELIEQLGMSPENSVVAKAVQIIRDHRRTSLPTPINLQITPTY